MDRSSQLPLPLRSTGGNKRKAKSTGRPTQIKAEIFETGSENPTNESRMQGRRYDGRRRVNDEPLPGYDEARRDTIRGLPSEEGGPVADQLNTFDPYEHD